MKTKKFYAINAEGRDVDSNVDREQVVKLCKKVMKKHILTIAQTIQFFNCEYVTTGRAQRSSETLNEFCREVESKASIEGLIGFINADFENLKSLFYEVCDELKAQNFVDFLIYEYGQSLVSFDDGGNVTYTLSGFR